MKMTIDKDTTFTLPRKQLAQVWRELDENTDGKCISVSGRRRSARLKGKYMTNKGGLKWCRKPINEDKLPGSVAKEEQMAEKKGHHCSHAGHSSTNVSQSMDHSYCIPAQRTCYYISDENVDLLGRVQMSDIKRSLGKGKTGCCFGRISGCSEDDDADILAEPSTSDVSYLMKLLSSSKAQRTSKRCTKPRTASANSKQEKMTEAAARSTVALPHASINNGSEPVSEREPVIREQAEKDNTDRKPVNQITGSYKGTKDTSLVLPVDEKPRANEFSPRKNPNFMFSTKSCVEREKIERPIKQPISNNNSAGTIFIPAPLSAKEKSADSNLQTSLKSSKDMKRSQAQKVDTSSIRYRYLPKTTVEVSTQKRDEENVESACEHILIEKASDVSEPLAKGGRPLPMFRNSVCQCLPNEDVHCSNEHLAFTPIMSPPETWCRKRYFRFADAASDSVATVTSDGLQTSKEAEGQAPGTSRKNMAEQAEPELQTKVTSNWYREEEEPANSQRCTDGTATHVLGEMSCKKGPWQDLHSELNVEIFGNENDCMQVDVSIQNTSRDIKLENVSRNVPTSETVCETISADPILNDMQLKEELTGFHPELGSEVCGDGISMRNNPASADAVVMDASNDPVLGDPTPKKERASFQPYLAPEASVGVSNMCIGEGCEDVATCRSSTLNGMILKEESTFALDYTVDLGSDVSVQTSEIGCSESTDKPTYVKDHIKNMETMALSFKNDNISADRSSVAASKNNLHRVMLNEVHKEIMSIVKKKDLNDSLKVLGKLLPQSRHSKLASKIDQRTRMRLAQETKSSNKRKKVRRKRSVNVSPDVKKNSPNKRRLRKPMSGTSSSKQNANSTSEEDVTTKEFNNRITLKGLTNLEVEGLIPEAPQAQPPTTSSTAEGALRIRTPGVINSLFSSREPAPPLAHAELSDGGPTVAASIERPSHSAQPWPHL